MRQTGILQLVSHYDAARTVLDAEIDYASRTRLSFVLPHAFVAAATIELGVREWEAGHDLLRRALELAPGDSIVQITAAYVRARLFLAEQRFADAAEATSTRLPSGTTPVFRAEYLGAHAIALACLGQPEAARTLANEVRTLTRVSEAQCLADGALAIADLRDGDETASGAFYARVAATGCFDIFVTAYRACPEILRAATIPHNDVRLGAAIEQARDLTFLASARSAWHDPQLMRLTQRERDVLTLLAEGMTNREIAHKLFITEVTAKVHLRHIYEKLNVRSRTEAAIKAAVIFSKRPPL
jgi:ATP/maltotriose-dependent transcriptional regulator MalT